MNETDLILEIPGKQSLFPPFSARDCTQVLTPLSQGVLRRTIGGTLMCIGGGRHRKFLSTLKGKDKAPPAFEGIWGGMILKVGCLAPLTQLISENALSLSLEREPVTCHVYDRLSKIYPIEKVDGKTVILSPGFPGGFITYRPWLMMMVKAYHIETEEWDAEVRWSLELEEV